MKLFFPFLISVLLISPAGMSAKETSEITTDTNLKAEDVCLSTPWKGKKVAFLGDSMTDPKNKSAKKHYWDYLKSLMGIEPHVFAKSGFRWDGIFRKAEELRDNMGDSIDVIVIWAGTNDYNHSVPLGDFYKEQMDSVVFNGNMEYRKHRTFEMTDSTFTGNINRVMSYLKHYYPEKQIVIMTPIHRGYARFNDKNIQPDENYANAQGLYIEDYIDVLRKAASLWAVPLIDLYSESGLYPIEDNHVRYFHLGDTDRLHPNDKGHYRIARTIQAKLTSLPPTF